MLLTFAGVLFALFNFAGCIFLTTSCSRLVTQSHGIVTDRLTVLKWVSAKLDQRFDLEQNSVCPDRRDPAESAT